MFFFQLILSAANAGRRNAFNRVFMQPFHSLANFEQGNRTWLMLKYMRYESGHGQCPAQILENAYSCHRRLDAIQIAEPRVVIDGFEAPPVFIDDLALKTGVAKQG